MNDQGVWQRFRNHLQNTAEIARRTKDPEHEIECVIADCVQRRFDKVPMSWMETVANA